MSAIIKVVRQGIDEEIESLSSWVSLWDPGYWVNSPPRDALLYEPDGVLYGIASGNPMEITWNHRTRAVRKGDLLIVPAELALEVRPEVDMFAVICSGTPPDHFRERFIQVWGYDHFSPPDPVPALRPSERIEVIPRFDIRYHVSYAIRNVKGSDRQICVPPEFPRELVILIGLEGALEVRIEGGDETYPLRPGVVSGIGPGVSFLIRGEGQLGEMRLLARIDQEMRRAVALSSGDGPPSPESHSRLSDSEQP